MTRRLGEAAPEVSDIGLGAMGMSGMYGATEEAESIATIHAALDAGINLACAPTTSTSTGPRDLTRTCRSRRR